MSVPGKGKTVRLKLGAVLYCRCSTPLPYPEGSEGDIGGDGLVEDWAEKILRCETPQPRAPCDRGGGWLADRGGSEVASAARMV